jgi:hypothetical protein
MATKKIEEAKTEVKAAETAPAEAKKSVKKAAESKPAAKKAPAKKSAAKSDEKKIVTKIQFGGKEIDTEDIIAACKADYKAKTNGHVRALSVYIKPEESTAYYVVNDKFNDKIEL